MYYDTHWYCAPLEPTRDNRTHALVGPIKGEPQFHSPGWQPIFVSYRLRRL